MQLLHATGRPVSSPGVFNDAPTTRQGDVHHRLDQTAARALALALGI
ncbi:hypothetical protein ACFV4P_15965 [Kitasatospora sp. NPDC059795]